MVVSMLLDDHARIVISDDPTLAIKLTEQGKVLILEARSPFIKALSRVGVLESIRPASRILRLRAR